MVVEEQAVPQSRALCHVSVEAPRSYACKINQKKPSKFSLLNRIISVTHTHNSTTHQVRGKMQSISKIRSSLRTCRLPLARASSSSSTTTTTPYRTADPAVHAEEPQGEDAEEAAISAEAQKDQNPRATHVHHHHHHLPNNTTNKPTSAIFPSTTPKLRSTQVPANPPEPPTASQQKRSHVSSHVSSDDVSSRRRREEEEKREMAEEYREYYRERKASPLSWVEFADTRKPITRATDGEKRDVDEGMGYYIYKGHGGRGAGQGGGHVCRRQRDRRGSDLAAQPRSEEEEEDGGGVAAASESTRGGGSWREFWGLQLKFN